MGSSILHPMEIHTLTGDPHTDEIDSLRSDPHRQTLDPVSLPIVHGPDRITSGGRGPHFDGNKDVPVLGEQVDLTIGKGHVGLDNREAVGREEPCGQPLSGITETSPAVVQMGSSDFSSSSTLTSRKVRTWT